MFLMKLKKYDNQAVIKPYWSEKFDGMRAFYEPVTEGMLASEVGWADTDKDKTPRFSTGLWSSRGKPIFAPKWFLAQLREKSLKYGCCLDGELYAGRGEFQTVMSVCRKLVPEDWSAIEYKCFDLVTWDKFTEERSWKNGKTTHYMRASKLDGSHLNTRHHFSVLPIYHECIDPMEHFTSLPAGSEGIVIRGWYQPWMPKRCNIYKLKGVLEGTGTVIGSNPGKGKLLGMMGNLIIRTIADDTLGEVVFELSGFTEAERRQEWSGNIDFSYRELTKAGLPKEARYLRRY